MLHMILEVVTDHLASYFTTQDRSVPAPQNISSKSQNVSAVFMSRWCSLMGAH